MITFSNDFGETWESATIELPKDLVWGSLSKIPMDTNKSLEDSQHWQSQYKDSHKLLSEKTRQFIDAEIETKLLAQQLIDAKQTLTSTQD